MAGVHRNNTHPYPHPPLPFLLLLLKVTVYWPRWTLSTPPARRGSRATVVMKRNRNIGGGGNDSLPPLLLRNVTLTTLYTSWMDSRYIRFSNVFHYAAAVNHSVDVGHLFGPGLSQSLPLLSLTHYLHYVR